MEVVFAVALLVLAAAVVLLYAMVAELASRTPAAEGRSTALRPVPDAPLGRAPAAWPAALAGLAQRDTALLLVLSTACGSCADVAAQLRAAERADPAAAADIGLVISCGTADAGREFLQTHGLAGFPHLIDEDGGWVSEEFEVRVSPTGLVLHGGQLEAALLFSDLTALRAAAVPGRAEDARR
jgi:bacterioferritin-associated ferredoxin